MIKKFFVISRLLPRSQAEIPWSNKVLRLDFQRPLPFRDDSFEAIYSSHTLEHLYFQDAANLLKECIRVLKPSGICRMVVPDLASMVERYHSAKLAGDKQAGNTFMTHLLVHEKSRKSGLLARYHQFTAFHQHKWMYDGNSLQLAFSAAGFKNVRVTQCMESRIARIAEVEDPGRILNGEGVVVEGEK